METTQNFKKNCLGFNHPGRDGKTIGKNTCFKTQITITEFEGKLSHAEIKNIEISE